MSLLSSLAKMGIANKVIAEAKKPQNQQKAKDLFANLSAKAKSRKPRPN